MGTNLIIISNHCVDYAGFDFDRLGQQVAAKLNHMQLPDLEFHQLSRLYWEGSKAHVSPKRAASLLRPWHHVTDEHRRSDFYADDETRGLLYFEGPFEWTIDLWPGKVEIGLLPCRYWSWIKRNENDPNNAWRTAYRKALATVVQSLGGDQVTYLADNSHILSLYWETEDYNVMRQELQQAIGPPLSGFAAMEQWQATRNIEQPDQAYLVDDFSDLNWSEPIALPSWLQKFRDKN